MAVAPIDTVAILAHRLLGLDLGRTWSPATETIVLDLRLPRVLSAMVVGLGLAVAGTTFQGILRNPLADPYVLGTASGAALGAAIGVLIPIRIVLLEFGLVQVLAFVGALLAVAAVYRFSRTGALAPLDQPAPDRLRGRLAAGRRAGDDDVPVGHEPAPDLLLPAGRVRGIVVAPAGTDRRRSSWPPRSRSSLRARSLNGFLLGEEAAAHLGVDVRRERAILLGLASLITAAAVSIAGLIGFVGLVVPHVVRLVVGPNARRVLPLSALIGASLLAAADLVARLAGGIPVGVVTAVIGAPFFLVLLRRARSGYEL